MANVDMLEIAKSLDPRIMQDMPDSVAEAFAQGDIVRIFRTSQDLPPKNTSNQVNAIGFRPDPHGEYKGSIYVVHKDGRVARFKSPEISARQGTADAGWHAKTLGQPGESPWFDRAHVFDVAKRLR